jgi:hypothetical protein
MQALLTVCTHKAGAALARRIAPIALHFKGLNVCVAGPLQYYGAKLAAAILHHSEAGARKTHKAYRQLSVTVAERR